MRTAAGLTSPEERVGQMAHDFAMLACAAPTASCPARGGATARPPCPRAGSCGSKRSSMATARASPDHPAAHWAGRSTTPMARPRPAPRRSRARRSQLRPRKLSVTEIETWLRDPYAIYARHILRLRALDPLEQNADAADYGVIVHKAVAACIAGLPARPTRTTPRPGCGGRWIARSRTRALRPALAAWWRPRSARIADWLAETETRPPAARPARASRASRSTASGAFRARRLLC